MPRPNRPSIAEPAIEQGGGDRRERKPLRKEAQRRGNKKIYRKLRQA